MPVEEPSLTFGWRGRRHCGKRLRRYYLATCDLKPQLCHRDARLQFSSVLGTRNDFGKLRWFLKRLADGQLVEAYADPGNPNNAMLSRSCGADGASRHELR